MILYAEGDGIKGELIAAQFRKIRRIRVTSGTSTHKIQKTKLEGTVFCVIERPLKPIRERLKQS